MRTLHDVQYSPYSPAQLFDLVIDIERYPEFLPWCRAARILKRAESGMQAELVVHFKHITENYVSDVTFVRPSPENQQTGMIEVTQASGPFETLVNHWRFTPLPEGGTEIKLELRFRFRSRLLDAVIGLLFGKAVGKMAKAFKDRADALYA
jgi:coenzyme Q-binding protein COQ10